jgi:hypothetical protein
VSHHQSLSNTASVQGVALNVQRLLGKFSSALGGIGISVVLGFDPLPSGGPFQQFWSDNRVATLIILAVIVVIGALSFLITRRGRKPLAVRTSLRRTLGWLSESAIEVVLGFTAGVLLGLSAAPSTIPLLAFLRTHPPIGIGIAALLLIVLIVAPLVGASESGPESGPESAPDDAPEVSHSRARIWLASSTSLVTSALLFGLIGLITIRPPWCPTTICPPPQLIVVTNSQGVNDGVMEAYYLAQQGSAFVMTQDSSTYTFANLPDTISAVEIGSSSQPYRAVIGVHSLQRDTRYGLIIDGVDVLFDNATPVNGPVNTYLAGASLAYNSHVSTFIYSQQSTPSTQPTQPPESAAVLEVGGSDELAVQVTTRDEAYLQFRLQVHYHEVVGDTHSRALIVPHEFGVYFIAPSHWRPYIFSGGKMIPQSTGWAPGLLQ